MKLLQEKLDVVQKKRSNLFNWRGQFTPELVEYLLGFFVKETDFVIDPFSGSGTVLQEAARKNIYAEGFEINPAAYAMSKFFTFSNLAINQRLELLNRFELKFNAVLPLFNGEQIYQNYSDYRQAYSNLINFGKSFQSYLDKAEKILLLNVLFLSERDKNLTVTQSLCKSFLYVKNALLGLPYASSTIKANLADAREVHQKIRGQADLILTSPPYINVFNYHQNYRGLIEIFNFDILKIANSEFGSNRKNRGNRFKTIVQYSLDMEEALRSFWGALKPHATLVLILGRQSNVRNTAFYNSRIVMDIIDGIGGFEETNTLERKFTNKFGNHIKEDILIYRKTKDLNTEICGKQVALQHLSSNLSTATQDIERDLVNAMKDIDTISSSPMFNLNDIIIHA
ncbi:MAG: hypothetical protein BWK78_07030 [Thiotrichaceae bacterium IS1]|nr:MAG: hypothetical protein BWK78_07030 [Thiotrichaceae bacterium IS1]